MSQTSSNHVVDDDENHKNNSQVKSSYKFTLKLDSHEEDIRFVNIISGLSVLRYSAGNDEERTKK